MMRKDGIKEALQTTRIKSAKSEDVRSEDFLTLRKEESSSMPVSFPIKFGTE